jgi:hypothetical protein
MLEIAAGILQVLNLNPQPFWKTKNCGTRKRTSKASPLER